MVARIIIGIFSVLAILASTGEGRRGYRGSGEIDYRYGQYRPNNNYGYGYGNGPYGYGNGPYSYGSRNYYGNGQNWPNNYGYQQPFGTNIGIGGYLNIPLQTQFRGGLLGFLFNRPKISELPKSANDEVDDSAQASLYLHDDSYHVDEISAQHY